MNQNIVYLLTEHPKTMSKISLYQSGFMKLDAESIQEATAPGYLHTGTIFHQDTPDIITKLVTLLRAIGEEMEICPTGEICVEGTTLVARCKWSVGRLHGRSVITADETGVKTARSTYIRPT